MLTYSLILQTIASLTGIATSTSMIIAYRQLRLASRNSQLTFEDNLAREYRQLGGRVPLRAVLGEVLSDEEVSAALPNFFWYFDLSNEQVFLRRHGRVSDLTWETWAEGIRANMARPAFALAWGRITAAQPSLFADLRRFVESGAPDPDIHGGRRRATEVPMAEETARSFARMPRAHGVRRSLIDLALRLTPRQPLTPFPPTAPPGPSKPVRKPAGRGEDERGDERPISGAERLLEKLFPGGLEPA